MRMTPSEATEYENKGATTAEMLEVEGIMLARASRQMMKKLTRLMALCESIETDVLAHNLAIKATNKRIDTLSERTDKITELMPILERWNENDTNGSSSRS